MFREAERKPGQKRAYVRSQSNRTECCLRDGFRGRHQARRGPRYLHLRGVEGAWIKDMNILIEDGNVTGYKVNMEVTFVLDDS